MFISTKGMIIQLKTKDLYQGLQKGTTQDIANVNEKKKKLFKKC